MKRKAELTGNVDHFFHLGAIYDLKADRDSQYAVNVQGSQYAVEFAREVRVKTFHLMSSIAAAGFYPGIFREDMFSEATGLDHPYFSTKHESERIVREQSDFAFRIYRPSFVVGDSKTGQMDKVDGPYYLFNLLKNIRQALPPGSLCWVWKAAILIWFRSILWCRQLATWPLNRSRMARHFT